MPEKIRTKLTFQLTTTTEQVVVRKEPATPPSGCSANSFMINDGVCDELTNNQRCLFDGGDCCRQEKSTELCSVCTCRLDVTIDDLKEDYLAQEVNLYLDVEGFQKQKQTTVATVADVESLYVCSRICMDVTTTSYIGDWNIVQNYKTNLWRDHVNAWLFQSSNRSCSCLNLLTSSVCPLNNESLVPAHADVFPEFPYLELIFLQMSKMLTCGKLTYNCFVYSVK